MRLIIGRPTAAIIAVGLAVALGACTSGSPRTVDATLDDDMTIELSETEFSAGETVRFAVTNAGSVDHELYIGDEAAQRRHAGEMASGGMAHDEPNGVSVAPGATETLEITFDAAGELLAACHEPGHYEAGMVTGLTVSEP